MRRLVAPLVALAFVVAVAVVVFWPRSTSQLGDPVPPQTSPSESGAAESAAATEPPRPELAQFYAQDLAWSSCREEFECAELTVPLDYRRPAGETIEIALLRVPASGERIGSLVVNPGGPGAPGTDYAAVARRAFGGPLRERFDIVGFDPRGTGDSAPVNCLTDPQVDAFVATDPDPDGRAEVAELAGWVGRLGTGCARRSGRLASHISTAEAARDIDVLRAALGEERLTYFGASYGTKLGATYAELFPQRAGRLVLDGAVDVGLDSRQLSLEQAAGFETALRAYVENCVSETESCFLGDSVDEGLGRIAGLLDRVDRSPLPTDLGDRELRVGNAFYGLVAPLYQREAWPALSLALRNAFNGDGTLLLQFSDLYTSRGARGYDNNSQEAIYAINCLDDPYAVESPAAVAAELSDFEEASPTFGRVFAWGLLACSGMVAESVEPPLEIRAEGAAPIVVIGTTRDPATPYRWAEALAAQLDSGVLVTRDGDGHTAYNAGNACIDDAVEAFLIDGDVPEDGLSC